MEFFIYYEQFKQKGLKMKKILIPLLLFIPLSLYPNNFEKVLVLNKSTEDIIIDGIIDHVWTNADSVSDFIQYSS